MTGTQRRRVVLDTDPGIDDALAILLALASPEIDLAALTVVHGNCPLEDAVANALAVLHLGGAAQVPVAVGCDRPLLREAVTAQDTHGGRGLGYASLPPGPAAPVAEHAVDLLIREIMAAPGEVTLVAVGPLTNVPWPCARSRAWPAPWPTASSWAGPCAPTATPRPWPSSTSTPTPTPPRSSWRAACRSR